MKDFKTDYIQKDIAGLKKIIFKKNGEDIIFLKDSSAVEEGQSRTHKSRLE